MIHKTIPLYEDRPHIRMITYISEIDKELPETKRTAVLVLPGGGYYITSNRESETVAKQFFAAGMDAFVLHYSVKDEAVGYAPLLDAMLAMKIIRDNADEWNIDKNKVIVCGFSAGGHLAASAGTLWKEPIVSKTLGCSPEYVRPDGMILGYPVITAGDKAHKGSIYKLANKSDLSEEELDVFSIEKHVDERTCPAFVWHTANDAAVPVENSLYLCGALSKYKIPFELHVFPDGVHGLSIATDEVAVRAELRSPYVARWVDMALRWVKEYIDK